MGEERTTYSSPSSFGEGPDKQASSNLNVLAQSTWRSTTAWCSHRKRCPIDEVLSGFALLSWGWRSIWHLEVPCILNERKINRKISNRISVGLISRKVCSGVYNQTMGMTRGPVCYTDSKQKHQGILLKMDRMWLISQAENCSRHMYS